VPVDFWEKVRKELDTIKTVFMLAEWESRDLHKKSFDMTYGWMLYDKMQGVCTRGRPLSDLVHYLADIENSFPQDAIKMNFTDNHDKNSWDGTPFTNFGDGLQASMVLSAIVSGMPLVYSGQETGLNKSLDFYEKDEIEWQEHAFAGMYKKLFALKHRTQALWNGSWGGRMERIISNKPEQVISFYREKKGDKVIVIINFSSSVAKVNLQTEYHKGGYTELFTGKNFDLKGDDVFTLDHWDYLVLEKTYDFNQG